METILATAFGRTVNVQRGESDQIVEAAYYIFRLSEEGSSFSIAVLLPLLSMAMKTVTLAFQLLVYFIYYITNVVPKNLYPSTDMFCFII